jgi:hypothetical protein
VANSSAADPDLGPSTKPRWERVSAIYWGTLYLALAMACLIAARAQWDALDFLGVGWMLALALIPLLPWLLPKAEHVVTAITPRLRSFSLAGVKIELSDSQKSPLSLPTAGLLAGLPNDLAVLSSSTNISSLVSAVRTSRQEGRGPIAIIDLREGTKWLLRNLYFLVLLLEIDEQVVELVFTETRAGTDGYLVGTSTPAAFRLRIEQGVPAYADAASIASLARLRDRADAVGSQETAQAFLQFSQSLNVAPAPSVLERDALTGYLSSEMLLRLAGAVVSTSAVEEGRGTLSEQDLRTVLDYRDPYVPTVRNQQLSGLIDRAAVALSVSRAAVAST